MALSRKFLKALGIEEDKIEEIITAHTETVTALKEERDALKTDADALPAVKKELDELKKKAEASNSDEYKAQYDALKAEYDKYKADVAAQAETEKKNRLYRELAKAAGVSEKRLDAILKVTNLSELKLDKDGNAFADADKLTESIKTEWADFITTEAEKGANTAKPPADSSGKQDLGKLSMADYIAARKKKN